MMFDKGRGRGRFIHSVIDDKKRFMGKLRKNTSTKSTDTDNVISSGVDDDLSTLPGGYYKTFRRADRSHGVRFVDQYMEVEDKIYGKTFIRAKRYWNSFCRLAHSLSITLTGDSGGGKTLEGRLLANLGIHNGDLPVVEITGYKLDESTVRWMDENDEVIYFLDEYAKHTPHDIQELMLPLLTNTNKKSIFIITDNDKNILNRFFNNRPGRVRYSRHFGKLEREVVEEYMDDHGVSGKFREDLMKFYNMSRVFVIDHLKEIVVEHKEYPEDTLDEMLEILNVDKTTTEKKYYLVAAYKVIDSDDMSIEEIKDIASEEKLNTKKVKELDIPKLILESYSFEQSSYNNSVMIYEEPSKEVVEKTISKLSNDLLESKTIYVRGRVELNFNISNLVFAEDDITRLLCNKYIIVFKHALQNTLKPNILVSDNERELVFPQGGTNTPSMSQNRFLM